MGEGEKEKDGEEMNTQDQKPDWKKRSEEALSGAKDWREAHPKAPFADSERAGDERLMGWRARMVHDLVQESETREWSDSSEGEAPACPNCGGRFRKRGKQSRNVQSSGGKAIHLERSYASCLCCGYSVFPPGSGTDA
jgi:hypothetical protein